MSEDKATEEWLNAQKQGTASQYRYSWKLFLEFAGMNGNEILESRKHDKEFHWEKKVLEAKRWVVTQKNKDGEQYSDNTAKSVTTAARSFFSYYRLGLIFRRQETKKLVEVIRKTEDYRFSLEDLKKISDVGNLTEKYIVVAGKSFGLRAGDFLKFKRGDVEPYINRPVPISIGEYITHKEHVKAYPFIDGDALPIIKLMLQKMDREGRTKPTDLILTFSIEIQLSRTLKRLCVTAGINPGNKRIRFHCLRKFLIDRISSFMSESKWKQIVGKSISEGAYVSSESLREDYARAMSETCFKADTDLDYVKKRQEASEEIMSKIMAGENLTTDDKAKIARFNLKWSKKAIKPKDLRDKVETQHDGADCGETFEQINKTQLLSYLKAGWQVAYKLSDNEIIVKR